MLPLTALAQNTEDLQPQTNGDIDRDRRRFDLTRWRSDGRTRQGG